MSTEGFGHGEVLTIKIWPGHKEWNADRKAALKAEKRIQWEEE